MKMFALIVLFSLTSTNAQNIHNETLKEIFKKSDRDILINIQDVLGKMKEESTKEIQSIKEEMVKQAEESTKENILLRIKVDQILKLSHGMAGLMANQGFSFDNDRYTIGNTENVTYPEALKFCQDKNAEIFRPYSSEDYKFLEKFRLTTKTKYAWFPIYDVEDEGKFLWEDKTALTKADEEGIPWRNSGLYYRNDESRDCGIMYEDGGVYIGFCSGWVGGVLCSF